MNPTSRLIFIFFLLFLAAPSQAISSLDVVEVTSVDATRDIVFAEIADNGDSVIFLKKDSLSTSSADATADDWSFYIYSATRGDTVGVLRNADPAVFYGFSPGPGNSVLFTRKVAGVKSIYSSLFNTVDSALLVNQATYPAYVASDKPFNFAYIKDSDNIYVGGLLTDTPTLSVPAVKIFDLSTGTGAIRFMRWSPDANSLVFMLEDVTESTASIYVLTNIQSITASNSPITSLSDSAIVTRITSDTLYNAFPHFAGGDRFILYTRAIPRGNFKFSNFADTGGCTTVILYESNWDAVLYERNGGAVYAVDTTATRSAVSSSASLRGYILLVRDAGDTDGDLDFAVLSSTVNVTSASAGTFYFPANARLILEAGAVPTTTFTVVADTPKSVVRRDTPMGDVLSVLVPVNITPNVSSDSIDKLKVSIQVLYQDADMRGYVELATLGLVHDTGTPNFWRPAGGSLNSSENSVTFSPPHFSAFGIGVNTFFNVVIHGQSCLVRRRLDPGMFSTVLRRIRDGFLEKSFGRRFVKAYYEL